MPELYVSFHFHFEFNNDDGCFLRCLFDGIFVVVLIVHTKDTYQEYIYAYATF